MCSPSVGSAMKLPQEIASLEWKTKDGRSVTVGEMDPAHMRNVLRMLFKNPKNKEVAVVFGGYARTPRP